MRRALLIIALIGALPTAASAQYQMISPMLYNGPRISLQDHADRSGPSAEGPRTSLPRLDPTAMTFRPDPDRRKSNLASFVAKTRAVDPADADNLARLFAQGDFFGELQPALDTVGLRIENVADAYALYWITAYQATHGLNPTPSRQTVDAVKQQALRAMARTREFSGASDATKQELAEALWIQSVMLDGAIDRSKGKPEMLAAVGNAAAQGARGMGIDLASMELTDGGFVPRKRP